MNQLYREGSPPRRVAVLRALQLGDMLCAVPAFRALRAALPEAEIVLIGLPWARELVDRFQPYLDGFLEFPGFPGLPERLADLENFPRFVSRAQGLGFDAALQLHGSGTITNPLTVLLRAPVTAGFYNPGEFCPDTGRFLPYPREGSEIWRNLRLLEHLEVPPRGDHLEFPLRLSDLDAMGRIEGARALRPGKYVCVHPGARWESRRWNPERFAAVADALAERGLRVVLTGTAGERSVVRAVAEAMRSDPLDLSGKTSLGALAALLAGARLLVCNDTGVSHLAAALGVPSVVLFLGSEPGRWAPLNRQRHRAVLQAVECRPCSHRQCPIGHTCASRLTPELVLREIEVLLHAPAPERQQVSAVVGGDQD